MKLPIDIVPGTHPPRFCWQQVVEDLSGGRNLVEQEGSFGASIEKPLVELIALIKQLIKDNQLLAERVAAQLHKTKK